MELQVKLLPHVIHTRYIQKSIQMTVPIPQTFAINGSAAEVQDLISVGTGTFTRAINYLLCLFLPQVRQYLY